MPIQGWDAIMGSSAPRGDHTSAAQHDRKYEHFCDPCDSRAGEFSADANASRKGKKGMLDGNRDLPRAESGAVKGSQNPLFKGEPGSSGSDDYEDGGMQETQQAEFIDINQWDGEQEHTWPRKGE